MFIHIHAAKLINTEASSNVIRVLKTGVSTHPAFDERDPEEEVAFPL